MANRVCWNCEVAANQTFFGKTLIARDLVNTEDGRTPQLRLFYAASCDSCGCGSIAEARGTLYEVFPRIHEEYGAFTRVSDIHPSDLAEHSSKYFHSPRTEIIWHPAYAQGKDFPDVPEYVASPASEAWACFNAGLYRSAAVMARAVVEATAKDKGAEPRDDLVKKIKFLGDNHHLTRPVLAAADEVRLSGNEAAHGDPVEPITEETCRSILTFMELVLHDVYQLGAKVARVSELRAAGRGKATD